MADLDSALHLRRATPPGEQARAEAELVVAGPDGREAESEAGRGGERGGGMRARGGRPRSIPCHSILDARRIGSRGWVRAGCVCDSDPASVRFWAWFSRSHGMKARSSSAHLHVGGEALQGMRIWTEIKLLFLEQRRAPFTTSPSPRGCGTPGSC